MYTQQIGHKTFFNVDNDPTSKCLACSLHSSPTVREGAVVKG